MGQGKNENGHMRGKVAVRLWGRDGSLKEHREFKNTLTNTGFADSAWRLIHNTNAAAFDYIAVGTDNTAASSAQTALIAEIVDSGLARAQDASPARTTTTVTNDTSVLDVTYNITGTKAIYEYGLLNAASAGTMLARQVDAVLNVVNGETLQVTWNIQHLA